MWAVSMTEGHFRVNNKGGYSLRQNRPVSPLSHPVNFDCEFSEGSKIHLAWPVHPEMRLTWNWLPF